MTDVTHPYPTFNDAPVKEEIAAKLTGFSTATLKAGRRGFGVCANLPYVRVGRSVRYIPSACIAWLHSRPAAGPNLPRKQKSERVS